ncbi:MAG: DegQ family serine endoprotease [Deltaproteobacteria bacterium]|nr:DegQ family serine endoprotease [Deltaproteobacteria bacterium]
MKKESNRKNTFIMFLLAFLIGFFVVSLIEVLRSSFAPIPDMQTASAVSTVEMGRTPSSFADLADRLKPVVVNISTTKTVQPGRGGAFRSPFGENSPFERYFGRDDFFDRFFGDMPRREFKQRSLGSGFIITKDGYIFTNNHVVEQADKILVKLSDGKEYEAKIIGKDAKTDIALIKIKPDHDLPVAELGDSDKLRVGEWVMAIGNPFGLEQTVTAGIVSAKGRVIGAGPYDNFIQTDASINPGNSGGPLFNMEGKVIGINTAIVAQGQGIGFAIPVGMAKDILPALKSKGKVARAWLGVSIQDITEDIANNLNKKDRNGALVSEVFKGDPADKAGIKTGDIITEINGKAVKDTHELLLTIASLRVGDKINVKVLRDGTEKTFQIVATERGDEQRLAQDNGGGKGSDALGLTVQEITPEIARYLGVTAKKGVIVMDIAEGSLAEDVGIEQQDIILEINKVKISNVKEYLREAEKLNQKKGLMLLIKRGRATFFVSIRK